MKERQIKLMKAIKQNHNYCSKCDNSWLPFSEYTEDYCPHCEQDKIKGAKQAVMEYGDLDENWNIEV